MAWGVSGAILAFSPCQKAYIWVTTRRCHLLLSSMNKTTKNPLWACPEGELIWRISHRCAQRLISWVVLNPIVLTSPINYHSGQQWGYRWHQRKDVELSAGSGASVLSCLQTLDWGWEAYHQLPYFSDLWAHCLPGSAAYRLHTIGVLIFLNAWANFWYLFICMCVSTHPSYWFCFPEELQYIV